MLRLSTTDFFFNDTVTTEIYTLSLHDALPILDIDAAGVELDLAVEGHHVDGGQRVAHFRRSEEHTSELQSHSDLVCRLLLEKKKNCVEERWKTAIEGAAG